ncbi:group II intron reverse transcriptase/maturase [Teredinibacter franksiae]|uniref:group II intron reverse transcriptase/maturase n=1 Tax=Teredinibacter franksiae TaxID=2761453 RepID=UPI0016241081|nr:group II intron reverse transcriptase/maturase [Teredinibacter franksiae]
MTTALHTIAFKAQTHPNHRFQNLYGLLDSDLLVQSWGQINKQSACGIDGVTPSDFKQRLPENINRLHQTLKCKSYRANDVKRVFIPKSNGKLRPLGLPTLDDKIVQQSVSQILQSIWEQDFVKNSYGYRPNRSAHQAVHSLQLNLQYGTYGYVVEADIKGFFDNIDHEWLMRMLKQRIEDKALLNLINQWLKARIKSPEGVFEKPASGSPQGGVISPVLANIYLHYALDIWFEKRIKPRLQGRAMLIRYADDFVVAFQYANEAREFYRELPKRLREFKLDVAPEKTHLKRFSRFHPGQHHSFEFLGFEYYWDTDKKGEARLRRHTAPKKHKAKLSEFYQWIKANRSKRLNVWMPQLRRKLTGFINYFGLPDNSRSVARVYDYVLHSLYKWLNRRSQRHSFNWQGFKDMLKYFQIQQPRVWKRHIQVDWY